MTTYFAVLVDTALAIEVQRVFTGEAGMFGVEVMKPVEDGAHVGHFAAFGVKLTRRERLHHQEQRGETQQRCDQSVQRAGPGVAQAQRPPGVVPLHHAVRRDVLCRRTRRGELLVARHGAGLAACCCGPLRWHMRMPLLPTPSGLGQRSWSCCYAL